MNRALSLCGRLGLPALATAVGRSWWAVAVLGVVLVCGLLAEWQRRITLTALIRCARPGTVIVQEKGLCGPALRVQVGGVPEPGPSPGEVDAQ